MHSTHGLPEPDLADTQTSLGIALAGQGRLEEAEATFRQVVQLRPDVAEAHNFLGVVLAAREKREEAIAEYRQALRLRPDFSAASSNLADALKEQGCLEEALMHYRQALRLDPHSAAIHYKLGDALREQGGHVEAVANYQRALELRPDAVEVHASLAAGLTALGRQDEALVSARQALSRLHGGSPVAFFDLGTIFLKLGQFTEAVQCYRRALRLRPDDPDTLNNLGSALWEAGHLEDAEALYRQAAQLRPDDVAIQNNLGNALRELGRAEEAVVCYRRALGLRADSAEALMNLGVVLSDLGELDEATVRIRQALELRPDWPAAHDNLGTTFLRQGKRDLALGCYEQALRLQGDYAEAHRNRAMAWLSRGEFERGWSEYEWRWRCRGRRMMSFAQLRWEGEDLAGRTILLHCEQGLGDTLQFIRYAPLVKRFGGTVLVVCPQPLVRLLAFCPGIDRVCVTGSALPAFDVHAPLLSLPRILGTTLATVPARVPYLFAAAERIAQWRETLSKVSGFRIGIAWQGNPRYRSDRHRSFPLAKLFPLSRSACVHLVSLQKGTGIEQLGPVARLFPVTALENGTEDMLGDFLDTAALVKNLDLVVTPDASVAHLAGGLGVPVWVALPFVAEWRWLADRADSPWYPTMRLFRQTTAGDWDDVFERMADALDREVSRRQGE